jgi:uncharacterized membrane protein
MSMTDKTASNANSGSPVDRLKSEAGDLASALVGRALGSVRGRIEESAGRLHEYAENGGGPGLKAALTGADQLAKGNSRGSAALSAGASAVKGVAGGLLGKGGGSGGGGAKSLKVTNIVESIDVGAPIRLVYDQWTQFTEFPSFMKKVEKVEQESEEKLNWQAQIFLSHRSWEATVQEQIPDRRIIWTSKGEKGHVDGAVTFHELEPEMTRVLVVLEYWPQGFFEQTANMWRAQGRRVRLELKHFRRHVTTNAILHPDEIEGWRGVIEDGEVVKDHETAIREERESGADDEYAETDADDTADNGEDEGYDEDEPNYGEDEADYDDEEDEDEDEDEDDAEDAEPVRAGSRRSPRR